MNGIVSYVSRAALAFRYDVSGVPPEAAKPPKAYPPPERDPGAPNLLDPALIHGLAGDVVRALLPWTEADPAALLLDFLTAFGSAVGPGPHMYVGNTRHDPKLYTVLVGGTSSGRKGTARDVVRHLFDYAAPEWARENVQSGLSSGEGLIQAMADMPGVKNLLAVETEFSKVLTVASRNGNTVSDHLRQLWEGDRVRVLNKRRVSLDGAYFSLIGHVTATELRAKMAEVDLANGFANRILWTYAQRSKLIPTGSRIPDAILIPLAIRVGDAIATARGLGEVRRTRRAAMHWAKQYLRMAEARLPGMLGAVTDRREAQCLRLALAFAALAGSREVRPQHVAAAADVWRYCEETAAFVFGRSSGNPRADKVLTVLQLADGGALARSDVRRHVFSNNIDAPGLDAIRDVLVEAEAIEVEVVKTTGRDAEVWKLLKSPK